MDAPLATVLVALIGAFIALTVAWRTNFVAEDFRRFRDGSALAAALLGELRAYEPALPMLKRTLRSWIAAVDNRTSAASNGSMSCSVWRWRQLMIASWHPRRIAAGTSVGL